MSTSDPRPRFDEASPEGTWAALTSQVDRLAHLDAATGDSLPKDIANLCRISGLDKSVEKRAVLLSRRLPVSERRSGGLLGREPANARRALAVLLVAAASATDATIGSTTRPTDNPSRPVVYPTCVLLVLPPSIGQQLQSIHGTSDRDARQMLGMARAAWLGPTPEVANLRASMTMPANGQASVELCVIPILNEDVRLDRHARPADWTRGLYEAWSTATELRSVEYLGPIADNDPSLLALEPWTVP